MTISIGQVGTLLTGKSQIPADKSYDLITGGVKQDVLSNTLGVPAALRGSNLTDPQSTALTNLENFIRENVAQSEAGRLLEGVSALRSLLQAGNNNSNSIDPVFSLLASNPTVAGALSSGSVIDQLL